MRSKSKVINRVEIGKEKPKSVSSEIKRNVKKKKKK